MFTVGDLKEAIEQAENDMPILIEGERINSAHIEPGVGLVLDTQSILFGTILKMGPCSCVRCHKEWYPGHVCHDILDLRQEELALLVDTEFNHDRP